MKIRLLALAVAALAVTGACTADEDRELDEPVEDDDPGEHDHR